MFTIDKFPRNLQVWFKNEFCLKEIFYMTPKCIRVITWLSIIVMLIKSWNGNNRKTFMSWFSIAESFHGLSKSFVYISCKVVSTTAITISTLNLIQRSWIVVMVTYCFCWCAINRNTINLTSQRTILSCDCLH